MYLNLTMSTWIITEFEEVLEALILEFSFLNPEDNAEKRFRYRFRQVPIKCSRELCIKQTIVTILQ